MGKITISLTKLQADAVKMACIMTSESFPEYRVQCDAVQRKIDKELK